MCIRDSYIIEQTCFCAIHPSRRVEYEALVKGLLKPGGRIIGLWFPLDKDLNDGGPPYGTIIDEIKSDEKNSSISQDDSKRMQQDVQKVTDTFISDMNTAGENKQQDILSI